jgi:CrcB protein
MTLRDLALVALGGGAGSAARYVVAEWARLAAGATAWPVGTLLVNVSGSFLIGALSGLALLRDGSDAWRLLLITGALGGYTTFSAFSLENWLLLRQGDVGLAAANALLQVVVGIAAVAAGFATARAAL